MQLADVGETLNTPPTPNHPPCFCSQLRDRTTRWTRRLINEADRYRETQFGLLLISSCHNKLLLNTSWRDLHIVFSNINLSLNVPQSLVAVLYFTMLLLSKCHQNAGTQCLTKFSLSLSSCVKEKTTIQTASDESKCKWTSCCSSSVVRFLWIKYHVVKPT